MNKDELDELEYYNELDRYETLYEFCNACCEEILAKRLGHKPGESLEESEYDEALKILRENWKEIEDEICDLYGEEIIEEFCLYMKSVEDDFRPEVKEGMEDCERGLESKSYNYHMNEFMKIRESKKNHS